MKYKHFLYYNDPSCDYLELGDTMRESCDYPFFCICGKKPKIYVMINPFFMVECPECERQFIFGEDFETKGKLTENDKRVIISSFEKAKDIVRKKEK
jgi:hypothetical protein